MSVAHVSDDAVAEPCSSRGPFSPDISEMGSYSVGGSSGSRSASTSTSPILPVSQVIKQERGPENVNESPTVFTVAPASGVTLHRSRQKRPSKKEESDEHARKAAFDAAQAEVISVGPFSEQLATFGHRMPAIVYNALRKKWCDVYKDEQQEMFEALGARKFRIVARKEFSKAAPHKRKKLMEEIVADEESPPDLKGATEAVLQVWEARYAKTDPEDHRRHKANVVMLVYNDDRFVMPRLQADGRNRLDDDELVQAVRKEAEFVRLKTYFFQFCEKQAKLFHSEWAASVEISPQTYQVHGQVRLHLTLCLGCQSAPLRFYTPWTEMAFRQTFPIYRPKGDEVWQSCMLKRQGFHKAFGQAAYYLQMPKVLSVAAAGSRTPFKDFPVSQTTITGYIQAMIISNFFNQHMYVALAYLSDITPG